MLGGELLEDQLAVLRFVAKVGQRELLEGVVLEDDLDEAGELRACLGTRALRPRDVELLEVLAFSG